MPERYEDEREFRRRGRRKLHSRGISQGSRFEDEYNRREREERSFGGGLGYGRRPEGGRFGDYASYPETYGGGGRTGRSSSGMYGGSRYYGGDEPASYGSQYRDYDEDIDDRYAGRNLGGRRWGSSEYRGVYGGYPESERGYMTDPELYERENRGWWDRTADEVASWFGDEEATRRRRMDEQREGYRGRGPRGYSRSDERIKEDINDEFTDSWMLDAWDLEVQVNDGNVILSGTVQSRYEKRLAEDIAEDVSGVKNVENHIRVTPRFSQDDAQATRSATQDRTSTTTTTGTSKSTAARGGGT